MRSSFLLLTALVTILSAAGARADCVEAPRAATTFCFAERPSTPDDVYLWPVNLHIGYGYLASDAGGAHALTLGLDAATLSYDALLVDLITVRVAFRDGCAGERSSCGLGADFFVGTRVSAALYIDRDRIHQLSFGAAAGWGEVGHGFGGRVGPSDGALVVAPSLRYAAYGLFGLELAVLLPVAGTFGPCFGDAYPAAVTVQAVGVLGALLALLMD